MKHRFYKGLMLWVLLLAGSPAALRAQSFSVPWFVIAGGGGTATNGVFSMTGTFGQWDASPQPLTNGLFALSGGFWGFLQNTGSESTGSNAPIIIVDSQVVVAISSPVNNFVTTSSNISVKGTLKGSSSIPSMVQITVNDNPPALASLGAAAHGVNPWTYAATLVPGANVITAQSIDTNGTEVVSVPVTRTVFYVTTPPSTADKSTLTLAVSPPGSGKISGQKDGASLELNKVYTIKATPGAAFVFSDWTIGTNTNNVLSYNPALSFIMQSNLVLQANFVTNPFPTVAGVYNGLFAASTGVSETSAGFFSATLAAKSTGAYTGKLMVDGGSYSFSGSFDLSGDSEATVARAGKAPVEVILHLDLDDSTPDDMMTGYVINFASGGWTSALLANRTVFSTKSNPAGNYAGKYTLVIPPGAGAPTNEPGGYSYATLANSLAGVVSISGSLSDKTAISQSTAVSKTGDIPLYVSLYAKKGLLLGWLTMTNESTNNFSPVQMIVGTNLAWIKPAVPKTLYPAGFTDTNLTATGSLYVPPAAHANVLNVTNGTLTVGNGDLSPALVFSNIVVSGTKVSDPNGDVAGTITPTTGLLALTIKPAQGAKITAKGVVLQDISGTNAAGWFPGADESGYFLLQP